MVKYCAGLWGDFPANNQEMYTAFLSYVKDHKGHHFNTYKKDDILIVFVGLESRYKVFIERMFNFRLVPIATADEMAFTNNLAKKCEVIF